MSEVSDALSIKLNTVRQTVHRALLDGQEWVKREPYPTPNDPVRWLIDTSHAIYQYHERRWKKLAEKTCAEQEMASGEGQGCCTSGTRAIEVTETWPELCRWLAEHGLVVFVNALADDQSWQWTWMEHAGSGYPDATAAITAAVQHQISESYPFYSPLYATPLETERPAEPELPLWNSLFRKKW
jgi:hypothetical protein